MRSLPETNWKYSDKNSENMLDWAVYSGCSKVMDKFLETMKAFPEEKRVAPNIVKYFDNMLAPHIPKKFQETHIPKVKELYDLDFNTSINGNTFFYHAVSTLLQNYLDKYSTINTSNIDQQTKNSNIFQLQNSINILKLKIEKAIEYGGADPNKMPNQLINLLAIKVANILLQISNMNDEGELYLAKNIFQKEIISNIDKLVKQPITLTSYNEQDCELVINAISVLGNGMSNLKKIILGTVSNKSKLSILTALLVTYKEFAKSLIEEITWPEGFNFNKQGFSSLAGVAEFGPELLEKYIKLGQKKSDKEKFNLINNPDFSELLVKIVSEAGFGVDVKNLENSDTKSWIAEVNSKIQKEWAKWGKGRSDQEKLNVNAQDHNDQSILHLYSHDNNTAVVKVLCKYAANVNLQRSGDAATPLHCLFLNDTSQSKVNTLEALLNKENKPPFDPDIKMVGNKKVKSLIDEMPKSKDKEQCEELLNKYNSWFDEQQSLLGESILGSVNIST